MGRFWFMCGSYAIDSGVRAYLVLFIQFDAVSNHKVQAVEYLIECGANVRVRV